MKKHVRVILVAFVIVTGLAFYYAMFTVRWQQKALVLTFGRVSRQVDQAGLNWCWPWEKVVRFDSRIRTYEPQAVQQSTEQGTIIVQVYVNWRIDDARVFFERFRSGLTPSQADMVAKAQTKTIDGWVKEAMSIFADYELGELVAVNRDQFKLAVAEGLEPGPDGRLDGMLQRVQAKARADEGYGIEIIDLGIARLGIPDSVTGAVFARMRADQTTAANKLLAEGRSEKKSIEGRAQGEAEQIIAKAQAEAKRIKGKGDAEAAQHYAVFLEHPSLANFLRQLETLRETLTDRTTVVLPSDAAPFKMLMTEPIVIDGE